jgi:hypothetical protein
VAAVCLYGRTQAAPLLATNLPGVTTQADAPAGFDPAQASDDSLRANGYPPRPDALRAPRAYAAWHRAVTAPAHRILPHLRISERKHRPIMLRGRTEATAYSSNWSGYALLNGAGGYGAGSFYYVMGDFTVPRVTQAVGACTGNWDYGATWVGIDGYGSGDVLQAGVDMDAYCGGAGVFSDYGAWYEWYPAGEAEIGGIAVSPGDDVFVEIWNTNPVQGGVYMVDYNANQAVTLGFGPPPGYGLIGNSAEWIVEAPGLVGGGGTTLANYSQEFLANAFAGNFVSQIYQPGAPAGLAEVPIVMLDGAGAAISAASLLGTNAMQFNVQNSAHAAGAP